LRLGDAGPSRRFLGHDDGAGATLGHDGVEMAQEAHGLEVFAAAVDVGNPGVGRPAVVAIEHGGHGIDPEPVDMIALQPMQRARDQETLHLAATEIVDVGVPVAVEAFARVEMLVQCRAVEARQAMWIGREMRRHPVEQQGNAVGVQRIDEAREGLRRAEPGRRREEAQRLIAPRTAERMLGDRQELDMGEAELGDIGDQALDGEIPHRAALVAGPQPRADMHLVDRDRRLRSLAPGPACHPLVVGPSERPRRGHDRGGAGGQLVLLRHRIGLVGLARAARPHDVVLVGGRPRRPAARTAPRYRTDSAAAWDGAARPRN
jgi:hypothetical protein